MHQKKYEFSKIMAVTVILVWLAAIIYAFVMMRITFDLSPLAYVMTSIDAVVAVVLGFYYWKARAENQIKLKKIYREDAPEPDFTKDGGY